MKQRRRYWKRSSRWRAAYQRANYRGKRRLIGLAEYGDPWFKNDFVTGVMIEDSLRLYDRLQRTAAKVSPWLQAFSA